LNILGTTKEYEIIEESDDLEISKVVVANVSFSKVQEATATLIFFSGQAYNEPVPQPKAKGFVFILQSRIYKASWQNNHGKVLISRTTIVQCFSELRTNLLSLEKFITISSFQESYQTTINSYFGH
jgi:hypothetical protein